ncbi:MAG: hypothetical protein AAB430_02460 [Patescibacteria group bacterium]
MKRKIKRFFPLFLAIVIIAVGFFLMRSDFFKIKSIGCELDQYPCPLIYEPVLVGLHNQNILQISSLSINRQLQALDPSLAEINLRRTLPDKIYLKLTRRLALARIESADAKVYFMDSKGEIFTGQQTSSQLPVINVPADKPVSLGRSDFSDSLFKLITALNEYFIASQKITWLPQQIIELQTAKGPLAVINLEKDISASIAALQYILSGFKIDEALPAKIDLRFDKPVLSYE